VLTLEDIHKSFTHHGNLIQVLQGIDLIVDAGDSLAIMGASGVGKSTLLNIMGSLDPPTKGIVRFESQDIYKMDRNTASRFRNKEIGFVFQFHHLLPELITLENVMMPALIARHPRKEAIEMAKEALEKVGLEKRLSHRAGELSGGEQQRVAIARAIIMRPKLILADEPTGNLDWLTGEEVAGLLLSLNRKGDVAVIVATHNHNLAQKMSRRLEIVGGRFR